MLVHCVGAYSRTPTVAALYGARLRNVSTDDALRDVMTALPGATPELCVPSRVAAHRVSLIRRRFN